LPKQTVFVDAVSRGVQHVGCVVTVVGRVKGNANDTMVHLEGSCGGDICIDRSNAEGTFDTQVVEVVGMVNTDRTVAEMRSTNFGNDMDLKMYNEMVLLANGGNVKTMFA